MSRSYNVQFERIVNEFVTAWAERLGVSVTFVGIRKMSTRWGSCTPKTRRIRINAALEFCPKERLEYIVVHELAHIREMNHSPRFWAVVAEGLPDYKQRQARLKQLQY